MPKAVERQYETREARKDLIVTKLASNDADERKSAGRMLIGATQLEAKEIHERVIAAGGVIVPGSKLMRILRGEPAPRIMEWSCEEWDMYADKLAAYTLLSPSAEACSSAMSDMPSQLQCDITKAFISEASSHLNKYSQRYDRLEHDLAEANTELRLLRVKPDREEILTQLSQEEIVRRFGKIVLGCLPPKVIANNVDQNALLHSIDEWVISGHLRAREQLRAEQQVEQMLDIHTALARVLAHTPAEKTRVAQKQKAAAIRQPKIGLLYWLAADANRIEAAFKACAKIYKYDKDKHTPDCAGCDIIVYRIDMPHHIINYVTAARSLDALPLIIAISAADAVRKLQKAMDNWDMEH